MSLGTKVEYVRNESPRVNTVMPEAVAGALKIKPNDILEWEGDRIIAKVRKA